MCSWLPERPWCLMQFSCPVVSIRIEFQRGVLKDMERLKAPVLLDGTCCVPLENQLLSLLRLARKNTRSTYCAALEKSHGQPTAPRSKNHTFSLMRARPRLRRPSRVPADPYAFPACAGPYAFPLAPDRFSFRYDLFFPFVIGSIELISVEAVFSAVGYDH